MTMTELEQKLQMEVIELLSLVREQHSQIKRLEEVEDEFKNLKKEYTYACMTIISDRCGRKNSSPLSKFTTT